MHCHASNIHLARIKLHANQQKILFRKRTQGCILLEKGLKVISLFEERTRLYLHFSLYLGKGLKVVSLLEKGLKVISLFEERTQGCIFISLYIQGKDLRLYPYQRKDSRSYLYLKKELKVVSSFQFIFRKRTQGCILLEKGLKVVYLFEEKLKYLKKELEVVSLLEKGVKVVSLFEERSQGRIFSLVYIQGKDSGRISI